MTTRFHARILTARQHRVLATLAPAATARGYYLGGGTAVALWLGHRRSQDFDWFSDASFDPLDLAAALREEGVRFETGFQAEHTLWGSVAQVKTSFIRFRYPPLRPTVRWPRYDVQLASLEDLVTMKLSAIVNRGSKKDFVDLYALGAWGRRFGLADMLRLYQRRFETADVAHVLYALTYFADAEAERMPRMLRAATWATVKRSLSRWVTDLG